MGSDRVGTPAAPRPSRRPVLLATSAAVLLTLAVVAAVGAYLVYRNGTRTWIVERLGGSLGPPPPTVNPGKVETSLRQVLLADRDRAIARGDLTAAAAVNARLGQEALLRAAAAQRAWVSLRHPQTKLLPERMDGPVWEYKDGASDCFGFLVQAGIRLNPETLPALAETLAAEGRLAPPGELCRGANAYTGAALEETFEARMFGSTEYVKDGLLSVYERFGDHPAAAPYRDRMFQVLDTVLARSAEQSKFGVIPGQGSEENGNVLQACSRLSFSAPNGAAYADMAGRIAEAYVQQVLPRHNMLPVRQFDFAGDKAVKFGVRIRDHGNEIIPGLAEAYAMAVAQSAGGGGAADPAWRARADRWADPIGRMYEVLLTKAVGADGLLVSQMDERGFTVTAAEPNDNWAYVLNGALLYAQAARRHAAAGGTGVDAARLAAIEAACDRVIGAVTRQYGLAWESGRMDGYADTLESGVYMIAHRPTQAATIRPWVDDQIGELFSRQRSNGVVDGNYLDGNFVRTSLLYADLCAGGWTVDPWRPDVRVGFAADGSGGAAVVVETREPYAGVLRPDRDRHRQVMKLPWDWPRLNSWPEHFVAADGVVVGGAEGMPVPTSAAALRAGVKIDLPADGRAVIRLRRAG